MERNKVLILFFVTVSICFSGCKSQSVECDTAKISIENRWNKYNGGVDYLTITSREDINFICKRINDFPEGKDIRTAYNYGYFTIFLNNHKMDMIFTYRHGVVYTVGFDKYVYDEALTQRVLKLMKIKKRCWGADCD